jgi:hypothetical protein
VFAMGRAFAKIGWMDFGLAEHQRAYLERIGRSARARFVAEAAVIDGFRPSPGENLLHCRIADHGIECASRQTISPSGTVLCARTACAISSARYGQLLNG